MRLPLTKKRFALAITLVALAASSFIAYRELVYVKQDFGRLAEYAKTENIQTLIRQVQSKPLGADGFTFVVVGDSQYNFRMAKRVMETIHAEQPDFVMSVGDLVQKGSVELYLAYHLPLVNILKPAPLIPVPGNHDAGPNHNFDAYKALYGADQFSFDYGGCRFVGFNDSTIWGMTPSRLRFLEKEFSKPGAAHTFLFMHIPPDFLKVFHGKVGRGFHTFQGAFHALLVRHKVECVFMGHVHGYSAFMRDGVRYIITAGGGGYLAEALPDEAKVHNYMVIRVGSDGVHSEVVQLIGDQWVRKPL